MTAHARWERRGNRIDAALRRGRITEAQARRAHIRNDRDLDDALDLEERADRGAALADNVREAAHAC